MMLILLEAIEATDGQLNAEKTKYIFKYRHKYVSQNHILKIDNSAFETAAKLQS
jgi:hypothetical protein